MVTQSIGRCLIVSPNHVFYVQLNHMLQVRVERTRIYVMFRYISSTSYFTKGLALVDNTRTTRLLTPNQRTTTKPWYFGTRYWWAIYTRDQGTWNQPRSMESTGDETTRHSQVTTNINHCFLIYKISHQRGWVGGLNLIDGILNGANYRQGLYRIEGKTEHEDWQKIHEWMEKWISFRHLS